MSDGVDGPAGQGGAQWQQGPAPGWYADPSGVHEARWWDGTAWTGHIRERGVDPTAAPSTPSNGGTGVSRVVIIAAVAAVVVIGVAALALIGGSGPGPSAGTCAFASTSTDSPSDTYLTSRDLGWLQEVGCSEPHNIEVLHTISLAQAEAEDIDSLSDARRFCREEYFELYVGIPYESSSLEIEAVWLGPDDLVFDDEKPVVCVLLDVDPRLTRTESLRGSGR